MQLLLVPRQRKRKCYRQESQRKSTKFTRPRISEIGNPEKGELKNEAGQHADDVRAVLDGSWRDLHGEASEAFVLRNLAP